MKKTAMLRRSINLVMILMFSFRVGAQSIPSLDKSPLDIAYLRTSKVANPIIKVIYGRPALQNDQEKLEDKLTYGSIWHIGANDATEIKFYTPMLFGENYIAAGTYKLLTIPGEKQWEIILNRQVDTWGTFQYNPAANVIKIAVPVKKAERLAVFSIGFKTNKQKTSMVLAWDQARIYIPIQVVKQDYLVQP